MTIESIKTTDECPATLQELLNDMQAGKYNHLQIMLHRNKDSIGGELGQKYLIVNNIGFGLYQLNDMDYKDGVILMTFTNPSTGKTAELNLDINNKHQQTFLIRWNDIKDMVYADNNCKTSDEDLLLDFDY